MQFVPDDPAMKLKCDATDAKVPQAAFTNCSCGTYLPDTRSASPRESRMPFSGHQGYRTARATTR